MTYLDVEILRISPLAFTTTRTIRERVAFDDVWTWLE
jgi:hypothetical protein